MTYRAPVIFFRDPVSFYPRKCLFEKRGEGGKQGSNFFLRRKLRRAHERDKRERRNYVRRRRSEGYPARAQRVGSKYVNGARGYPREAVRHREYDAVVYRFRHGAHRAVDEGAYGARSREYE